MERKIFRLGRFITVYLLNGIRRVTFIVAMTSIATATAPAFSKIAAKQTQPAGESALLLGDYLSARIARDNHDFKTAAPLMIKVWGSERDNQEYRHDALLLAVAAGDFPGALEIARVVPVDSSDASLADVVLTADDFTEGRFGAAVTKLSAAHSQGLDRYTGPLLTAWAQVGQGHKTEALAALGASDALAGTSEVNAIQSAMIAEAVGEKQKAADYYEKILDGKPSARALTVAAQFYRRQGAFDQARAAIERLDPDGASSSLRIEMLAHLTDKALIPAAPDARSGAADTLFEVAASLSGQPKSDIAPLLYVQLALHLKANFPSAQLLLSEIDQRFGRLDDSVAVLLAIDEKSELRSTALRVAMAMLEKDGDGDKAIKLGKSAIQSHPQDIDLLLSYADLLRIKSHFPESIAAYDLALTKIAATSNRRGIALYHRGMAYQEMKQWPQAEADLLAALKLRPDDPGLLNYLAFSWADQGINLDRARTMLDRAVQLVPDDGAIVDSLGWVMFRAGDYAEAVKQLERAVSLNADDATINDHLGDAYWFNGRQIEARSQWEKAARMTQDKTLEQQIRKKLRDGLDESSLPRHAAN
jgi:tetratricopeptide (TPR) repeat protein